MATPNPEFTREQFLERPLPSSPDSERVILGAILLDNELITQAIEQISPENFTDIRLEIEGIIANRYIVPLTLLSVIQNALAIVNYDDFPSNLVIVNLTIHNKNLSLRLTCHYLKRNNEDFFNASFIKKIDDSFNTFRGIDNYEIQMEEQNQQLIIILNIPLLFDPVFIPASSSLQATSQFYESA